MSRTPPARLTDAAIGERLADLTGWTLEAGKLHKTYTFENFASAFGWMSACAIIAEKQNHHPEWFNVWATVTVDLTTHEAQGITSRDFKLAKCMETLAVSFCASQRSA